MVDALEQFRELQKITKGPRCAYQSLDLNEADLQALNEALGSASITSKTIQKWLEARNQVWVYYNIARHRRGDCRCANV
jgi:hypothetical protein